jgi:multidrug resistance efflux pump
VKRPLLVLALVLAPAALALAGPPDAGASDQSPKPPVAVVTRTDLVTGLERDGKVEAQEARRVVLDLEEFSGRLQVTEVAPQLRDGGRVDQGAVLLRVDPAPLDRALRAAREALDEARAAVDQGKAEDALARATAQDAVDQAEVAAHDAGRALERFQALDGPNLLQAADLDLSARQHGVDDQKEELSQLEAMYHGTQLAPETKEIVLERARRNLAQSEGYLAVQQRAHTVSTEWEHPDRLKALQDQAKWTADALTQLRERTRLEAGRRERDLAQAGRAARDAEERVARLEQDRERLTVKAPAAGLVEASPLRPGDLLGAGQALTTVHDDAHLVVTFPAAEEDLRVLGAGLKVEVHLPAFPEVELAGHVLSVEPIGEGDAPTFTTKVLLDEASPFARVGLRARVLAEGAVLKRALVIPRAAVTTTDGRTTCKVWANGRATPVEVVLGAGNREQVAVVHGLVSGDEVVVPEAP